MEPAHGLLFKRMTGEIVARAEAHDSGRDASGGTGA